MFSKPEKNIIEMNIGEGMVVADFGTGGGAYILPLLERVGQYGEVFAVDIQAIKLSRILNEARRYGYKNLSVIHSDLESNAGSHLKDRYCDRVIISNLFHKIEDKDAVIIEAKRVLKKTGLLVIIDWTESFNLIGPHHDSVFSKDRAVARAEKAGFKLIKEWSAGDYHYGLVFELSK